MTVETETADGAGRTDGDPVEDDRAAAADRASQADGPAEDGAGRGKGRRGQMGISSRIRARIAAWGTTKYFFSSKVISTAAFRKKIA